MSNCGHTEHAVRGERLMGRSFPKVSPDVGVWERCPDDVSWPHLDGIQILLDKRSAYADSEFDRTIHNKAVECWRIVLTEHVGYGGTCRTCGVRWPCRTMQAAMDAVGTMYDQLKEQA